MCIAVVNKKRGRVLNAERHCARGGSKLMMQPKRMVLMHELNAIKYWDHEYRVKDVPDAVDEAAFNARQKRREQILQTLEDLLSTQRGEQQP